MEFRAHAVEFVLGVRHRGCGGVVLRRVRGGHGWLDPWSRLRQRSVYTQRDEILYSISLCTEASVWEHHEQELDLLLATLELPEPRAQLDPLAEPEDVPEGAD